MVKFSRAFAMQRARSRPACCGQCRVHRATVEMRRATTEIDAGQWSLCRDADQVSPENTVRLAVRVLGMAEQAAMLLRGAITAAVDSSPVMAVVCLCDVEENRRADELALPHKALELEATPVWAWRGRCPMGFRNLGEGKLCDLLHVSSRSCPLTNNHGTAEQSTTGHRPPP